MVRASERESVREGRSRGPTRGGGHCGTGMVEERDAAGSGVDNCVIDAVIRMPFFVVDSKLYRF